MIAKALKRLGLWVCFGVVVFLIFNVIGAVWPRDSVRFESGSRDVTVYLVAGPIHYDFVVPITPDVRAAGVRVGAWTPTPFGLKESLRYFGSVDWPRTYQKLLKLLPDQSYGVGLRSWHGVFVPAFHF